MTPDDSKKHVSPILTGEDEPELLQLARRHFERVATEREKETDERRKWHPALTESEVLLIRKTADGDWADCSVPLPNGVTAQSPEDPNWPGNADSWGPERVFRAEVIVWLCTNKKAIELVTHHGLRVMGARIKNILDITEAEVPFAIYCWNCNIDEGAVLRRAKVRGLYFIGTHLTALEADGLRVCDGLFFRDGFASRGPINLIGSEVGGNLDLTAGKFRCETRLDQPSLHINSAKIRGSVFLRDGFELWGIANLIGIEIKGQLDCSGAKFHRQTSSGISEFLGDDANIGGNVLLSSGFESNGSVSFVGAKIEGSLVCVGGTFSHSGENIGSVFALDAANVAGNVMLKQPFLAKGPVSLVGTEIGGYLDCTGGQFLYTGASEIPALNFEAAKIARHVFLRSGFHSANSVDLLSAEIGGQLDCSGSILGSDDGVERVVMIADSVRIRGSLYVRDSAQARGTVNLIGAKVDGIFEWRDLNPHPNTALLLQMANVGALFDDSKSWPSQDRLELHGFTYDELYKDAPTDGGSRLDWLSRQPQTHFNPQPFEQLALVLSKQGYERDARKVRIAKERERARLIKMRPWQHFFHRLTGITIAYGHRPWQAMWWIVSFLSLGYVLFWTAHSYELVVPSTSWAYVESGLGGIDGMGTKYLRDHYPAFQPFIYSLDEFAPLVNLRQGDYWIPNANGGDWIRIGPQWLTTGRLISWYLYFHIIAGWTLTTLLVAGLTGLVRR